MRQNKNIVKLPRLFDNGGKVEKGRRWHVEFTYRNPLSGENKRFKKYDGINLSDDPIVRRKAGEQLALYWREKLINGYNPFQDQDIIYQDDLRYRDAAHVHKESKGKLKSIPHLSSLYMTAKKHAVRLSTEHTYRSKLRKLKDYCEKNNLHECDVSVFGLHHAEGFVRYLFTELNLQNKTVNEYIILMRNLWDYFNLVLTAESREVENPFKKIKKYKEEIKKPQVYSLSQLKKLAFLVSKEDPQLWIMIRFLFNCFIRPNEMRFLKIQHIDFVGSRVFIPAELSKNKKADWVDVPEYLMDDLIELGYHKANSNHYVFSSLRKPSEKPVSKNYFYKRFTGYRDACGLPSSLIPYALKHTGVAELKLSGADWLEIKEQLRHHSLDQVIEYGQSLLGQSSEHIRKRGPRI